MSTTRAGSRKQAGKEEVMAQDQDAPTLPPGPDPALKEGPSNVAYDITSTRVG